MFDMLKVLAIVASNVNVSSFHLNSRSSRFLFIASSSRTFLPKLNYLVSPRVLRKLQTSDIFLFLLTFPNLLLHLLQRVFLPLMHPLLRWIPLLCFIYLLTYSLLLGLSSF